MDQTTQRLLGYRPPYRVREGLEKTIDWYVASLPAAQPTERKMAHV